MVAMRGGVVVYDHGQRPPLLFGLKVQPECPADALLTTASVADAAARPPPLELCCGPPAAVGPPFRGLEASEPSDADATRTATKQQLRARPHQLPNACHDPPRHLPIGLLAVAGCSLMEVGRPACVLKTCELCAYKYTRHREPSVTLHT